MNQGPALERPHEVARRVERRIAGYPSTRAIVAFSGGVDSTVVLALTARALGNRAVTAVTAVSASYPAGELEAAQATARRLAVAHQTIDTREVELESYARNGPMRCFHCKAELFASLQRLASAYGASNRVVLTGANADDAADFRPGLLAGQRFKVRNPLLEERIGKRAVRSIAQHLDLDVAEKPALACLSSRVAYGIRITPQLLSRIDRAEQLVRARGFSSVRVRHAGEVATIEVPEDDVHRLATDPGLSHLMAALRALGWRTVVIDPAGLRSGSLNETLELAPSVRRAIRTLQPSH